MKVITRSVVIEEQEFVLIENEQDGKKYWGTIPYTEIDENGRMKRTMNGLEMMISFRNAQDAFIRRRNDVILNRLIKKYETEGKTEDDAIIAATKDPEYKALFA